MDNNSNGKQKNITGTGKGLKRRGEGLGTGPVGKQDGYAGRKQQQTPRPAVGTRPPQSGASGSHGATERGVTRAGGGKLIIIVILAVLLLGGGGLSGLFGNLLGGGGSSLTPAQNGSQQQGQNPGQQQAATSPLGGMGGILNLLTGGAGGSSSASSGMDLSGLLGGFSGGSGNVSSGWAREANVGQLDRSVASGARAKRTNILGNGKDQFLIMVYMCGTDLESKYGMATNDLNEMKAATFGSNVRIVVYTGGCKQWKTSGISNRNNQIYEVANGQLRCLSDNDGKDSLVKPATLTKFIKYCAKDYCKANKYNPNRMALIFWDHGGGSISGYGYDELNTSAGSMGLSGINSALKNAGVTFDFIGFDACLMATLETGLMLDNYADYMIASEETEPGIGWYYTNWLTKLGANTSMPTIELGKNIVDDFVAECNRRCAGQKTTLSVVDLAELSATVPSSLKNFATGTSKLLTGTEYKTVSDARSNSREFAASTKIDQIDLVHLCYNLATPESEALAKTLLGAVKYNKTSSSINNAYGISIFFPYQRTSYVKTAVSTYDAIGLDSAYSRCIQQFATLEQGGQQGSSSMGFDVSNLLGGLSSAGGGGADFSSLFGSLLGGRSLDLDAATAAQTVENNQFEAANLMWTNEDGHRVMKLEPAQWEQVHSLQLNVFYNDGNGFINLGLDNMYSFTKTGALYGEYDCTWVAIGADGLVQPVMFNYQDALLDGDVLTTTGTVPVLLNGELANLLVVFEDNLKTGKNLSSYIAGVRFDYETPEGEDAIDGPEAKTAELQVGDKLQFVADYYTKSGEFQDTYEIGDEITWSENVIVGYTDMGSLSEDLVATYLFTDIYNSEYWTAPLTNVLYED